MNILGLIDLPDFLVLTAMALTALYFHLTSQHGTFKALGVPGPKPLPVVGNREYFKLPLDERMTKLREKYGQVYGVFVNLGINISACPSMFIGDLDMVQAITIKDFSNFRHRLSMPINDAQVPPMILNLFIIGGDYWKTLRTIMSPTFTSGKLKQMVDAINITSRTLVSCLKIPADRKEEIVARKFTGSFTMDVIARVTMGVELNCQGNPDDKFVKNVAKLFQVGQDNIFLPTLWAVVLFPFLAPLIRKWTIFMGWKNAFFDDGPIRFFENAVDETIALRRASNKKYTDFLQLLQEAKMYAPSDNGDAAADRGNGFHNANADTSSEKSFRRLTHDELVGQCLLFFIAGHETTAAGLMFSFYHLALFPKIQDRLVEEINQHVPKDADPDYDAVANCKYMEMFLMETLRLYPSVGQVNRTASNDIRIGKYFIPKDSTITIPIWQIHHDPAIWEQPEMFDPERFSPDNRAKHHTSQWMPFGIGPRHCLGMRLAILEMKIALIHVIRQYRFTKCEKTEVPLKLGKTILVGATVNPVYVRVENREAA